MPEEVSVAGAFARIQQYCDEQGEAIFVHKASDGSEGWICTTLAELPEGATPFLTFRPGKAAQSGFHPGEED